MNVLPLCFEINKGQTSSEVKYLARAQNSTLFLTKEKAIVVLNKYSNMLNNNVDELMTTPFNNSGNICSKFFSIKPKNSNLNANVTGIDKLPGIVSYFKGINSNNLTTNIPTFKKVKYEEIYPNIDMIYYSCNNKFEWDFLIKPGGDTDKITLEFEGSDKLEINEMGDLLMYLEVEDETVCFHKPLAYQEIDGSKIYIHCEYIINEETVSFNVSEYNKEFPLIIDPILAFSSYLNNSYYSNGNAISIDAHDNMYISGNIINTSFPSNVNPYDPYESSTNGFLTKINSTGTEVVFTVIFGGNNITSVSSVALDSSNNSYIAGMTNSTDFPHEIKTSDLLALTSNYELNVTSTGQYNAFVLKVNSTGTSIIYSLLLGGKKDSSANAIVVDTLGYAYITGTTFASDFPVKNPIYTFQGKSDAFVSKINKTGTDLVYSTFLGGSDYDYGNGITIDFLGNAYVIGGTFSSDFPTINAIALNKAMGDIFVTKINFLGTGIIYSTYLGGNKKDIGRSIVVDQYMNAYITGSTESSDFTIKNNIYDFKGIRAAFITKLNETGELCFSTFLGGSKSAEGNNIALDAQGNIYIVGSTDSYDFPVKAPLFLYSGESDAFITELDRNGSNIIFSTFLGGSLNDYGKSISVDMKNNIYVTGETQSYNFPVKNPLYPYNGNTDAFVTKIINITPPPRSRGFDLFN